MTEQESPVERLRRAADAIERRNGGRVFVDCGKNGCPAVHANTAAGLAAPLAAWLHAEARQCETYSAMLVQTEPVLPGDKPYTPALAAESATQNWRHALAMADAILGGA